MLIPAKPSHMVTGEFPRCGIRVTMRMPLSPFPRWSQWGDRLAVSVTSEYRADVFEGPKPVLSIRFSDPSPPVSAEEAARLLEEGGVLGGPCNSTPMDLVEKYGHWPHPQAVRNVALDAQGRLWVEVVPGSGERRIDIYDDVGAYRGSLPGWFPMPLTFMPNGSMLIPIPDSLGVERLGLARVIEGS